VFRIERGQVFWIERGQVFWIERGQVFRIERGQVFRIERGQVFRIERAQTGIDGATEVIGISQGWPELYMYTVYDRIFGDSPAKHTLYTPYTCMVLANPIHRS